MTLGASQRRRRTIRQKLGRTIMRFGRCVESFTLASQMNLVRHKMAAGILYVAKATQLMAEAIQPLSEIIPVDTRSAVPVISPNSPNAGNSKEAKPPEQARAERLEEYKFLRTEIESIWSQTYATLNFLLAFIGLVVAGVFSKDIHNPDRFVVLLGTAVVTSGGYYLIYVHTGRIWRITTYMRWALEPGLPGIGWETRLAARHAALKIARLRNSIDRTLFNGHMLILHCVNAMLSALVWWTWRTREPGKDFVIPDPAAKWFFLFPIALILLSYLARIGRGGRLEKDQERGWSVLGAKLIFNNATVCSESESRSAEM